jgi:hypothetical protein
MEIPVSTRYFAFGCSYTNYYWPTYADYLGTCFDEYYNLGAAGAGNRYIFLKLLNLVNNQELLTHSLGKEDLITIQWSGLPREDKILPKSNLTSFALSGHLGSQGNYPDEYVQTYFSLVQSAFELSAYITAAKTLLKSLGVHFKMFYMMEPEEPDFLGEVFLTPNQTLEGLFAPDIDILTHYGMLEYITSLLPEDILSIEKHRILHTLDKEKDYYIVHKNEDGSFGLQKDTHPTPYSHYEYAKYLGNKVAVGTIQNLDVDYTETFSKFDHFYSKETRKQISTSELYDNNTIQSLFPELTPGSRKSDNEFVLSSTCLHGLLQHIHVKHPKSKKGFLNLL